MRVGVSRVGTSQHVKGSGNTALALAAGAVESETSNSLKLSGNSSMCSITISAYANDIVMPSQDKEFDPSPHSGLAGLHPGWIPFTSPLNTLSTKSAAVDHGQRTLSPDSPKGIDHCPSDHQTVSLNPTTRLTKAVSSALFVSPICKKIYKLKINERGEGLRQSWSIESKPNDQ